jgi:hypothetical protein
MALDIHKLEPSHDVKAFDCGDVELNLFIKRFAWTNQELHMYGNTYVAYSEQAELIGYYTIANSAIPRIQLPPKQVDGAPRYAHIPALLLARLAVGKEHARKGNGEQLLRHCLNTVEFDTLLLKPIRTGWTGTVSLDSARLSEESPAAAFGKCG